MTEQPFNVLILCTGNSARSIIGEAGESLGPRQVRRLQRRQHPKGKVHPIALELLRHLKLPTDGLRSRAGMSSRRRARRRSISSSPSATTPRENPVRTGPASR
jgi:protein-tyrosine-phosphatase